MRGCKPTIGDQRGSALVAVAIWSLVMLISALGVLEIWRTDTVLAVRDTRASQAFFLAESGIQRAQAWLKAQDSPPQGTEGFQPFGDVPDVLAGGAYQVSIAPDPLNPVAYPDIYTISCVATVGGRARSLEVDVAAETFANYVYFTHFEHTQGSGNPAWFISSDYIDGPLHTNDQIHIMGDPTFSGYVQSGYGGPDDGTQTHNPMFQYWNGDLHSHMESSAPSNPPYDNPTFEAGYELGGPMIDLPTTAVIDDLSALASEGGIYLTGNHEFVFARDQERDGTPIPPMYGYVSYLKKNSPPNKPWTDVELSSINGVIYVNGGVEIQGGVVDGQVTIASNSQVDIMDDVVYRASDENGPLPECDDMLGIVAQGDIIVANTEANQDDCVIHAHILATDVSFKADNYAVGDPRGTLTVWGGICQKFRGAIGTGYVDDDYEIVVLSGYAKDYHYDARLNTMVPPGYEALLHTGTYVRLAWRDLGGWRTCSN